MTGPMGIGPSVNRYVPLIADNTPVKKETATKQEEKEVIPGGDYVTKTLGIPVVINCLYDFEGNLSGIGKAISSHVVFKKNNADITTVSGSIVEGNENEGTLRDELHNYSILGQFSFTFQNKNVKKITFERDINSYGFYSGSISIKLWGDINKDGTRPLIESKEIYKRKPQPMPPMQPDGTI